MSVSGRARTSRGLAGWAVGPGVALLLLAGLCVVTLSVVRDGPSVHLDDVVYGWTPGRGNGPLVPEVLALLVVDLATPALCVAAVAAITAALCLRARTWGPALLVAPALGVLTLAVLLGKNVIPRASPRLPDVLGDYGSYPSGHTATALVCAGVLAALVSGLDPGRRRLAWTLAAGWTLLVAVALVWLHFHWLSDVVASMFLGSLLLWLLLRWPLRLGARVAPPGRRGGPAPGR
ncbi:MAG TPA: phosphatase PAP2 family protein [Terrabacter sp.]|nr:phosphatase PAP2 family protein [Terrabacter sp.]